LGRCTVGKLAATARSEVPWASAGAATVVDSVRANKGCPALPAIEARAIFDKAGEAAAVSPAAVVVEKGAAKAAGAVLAVLAGAKVADLTIRWHIFVGCALAAKVDAGNGTHDPAVLTSKRVEAATLELSDPHRGHVRRARLDACVVEQEPTIAANLHSVRRGTQTRKTSSKNI